MYHLVSDISNFLIPLFRRIHYDMGAKQHEKLPVKPERQIERQTIQQAMHQQVVPIFSFRLRDKINLEDIIPDQVAHHQSEHGFANFFGLAFFAPFLFIILRIPICRKITKTWIAYFFTDCFRENSAYYL